MKQGESTGKIIDLQDLLVRLSDNQAPAMREQVAERIYGEEILTTSNKGVHLAHDGSKVHFFKDTFDHAFFVSPADEILDRDRVARIRWMIPFIQGKIKNSECWEVVQQGIRKRMYISYGCQYIVWLEERSNGGWKFKTTYNPFGNQLTKYIAGAALIKRF